LKTNAEGHLSLILQGIIRKGELILRPRPKTAWLLVHINDLATKIIEINKLLILV